MIRSYIYQWATRLCHFDQLVLTHPNFFLWGLQFEDLHWTCGASQSQWNRFVWFTSDRWCLSCTRPPLFSYNRDYICAPEPLSFSPFFAFFSFVLLVAWREILDRLWTSSLPHWASQHMLVQVSNSWLVSKSPVWRGLEGELVADFMVEWWWLGWSRNNLRWRNIAWHGVWRDVCRKVQY